ncbi:MAG: YceI family protein [Bacteroidetes bacterium]|nr:YceI family protein [Bacteroidota bacterium]
MNSKGLISIFFGFFSFHKKLIINLLVLPILSFTTKYETYPLPSFISNSLNLIISVKTNIECFKCEYAAKMNDTIRASANNESKNYKLLSGNYLIPVKLIDCHNKLMNNDLQNLLNVSKFPHIQIKIKNLSISKNSGNLGKGSFIVIIDGINKEYVAFYKNYFKENILVIDGNLSIDLSDFNISPPSKFFGLVKVDKILDVNFGLKLKLNN